MKLGEWLRTNNVSQADFAGRIGVHRSTVGRWLDVRSGKRPDWDVIPKITDATAGAVTANDFVEEDEAVAAGDHGRAA